MGDRPQKRARVAPKASNAVTAGELDPEAGQRPAFPGIPSTVFGEADGPPMDVADYLSTVRAEAARRPLFVSIKQPSVTARRWTDHQVESVGLNYDDEPSKDVPQNKDENSIDRPSAAGANLDVALVDILLAKYKDMRHDVAQVSNDRAKAAIALVDLPDVATSWRRAVFVGEVPVSSALLKGLTVERTLWLLGHARRWLSETVPLPFSRWILGLLARMPEVLTAEESSVLRELAKKCVRLRTTHSDLEPLSQYTFDSIIAIVCVFYGQRDLANIS